MDNNEKFAKEHMTVKWVSVDWGTPSKAVSKVLTRTADGFVEEGTYDRRGKAWRRLDGTPLEGIVAWSLIADSLPPKKVV